MTRPVAVVAGVGPGNGAAFARKLVSEGFQVAMLARDKRYLAEIEVELLAAKAYCCDLTDAASVEQTYAAIGRELGPVAALVYNAGSGSWGSVEETKPEALESAWRVNTLGCLLSSQQVIPHMSREERGAIIVIGATASLRGGAKTTAFAAAKAAQRSLAQSMARHLGPRGIHVAYVIIDGMVDLPRTREAMPDKSDAFFIQPDDIAASVHHLIEQPRSSWTFELDLRPFGESW